MKTKTNKLSFIVVLFISTLALVAFIFAGTYRRQENRLAISFTNANQYDVNIENSMSIASSVLSNYRTEVISYTRGYTSNPNTRVYNNSFAGAWYCYYGRLNLGLTDMSEKRSGNPYVVYHLRQFSHNFLLEIYSAIANLMPNYSIFGVGVAPQYNRIEVSLYDEQSIPNVIEYLNGLSLFMEDAIKFAIGEIPILSSGTADLTPIHSGGRLVASDFFGGDGTISAKAFCNIAYRQGIIKKGIITNAHVAPANTQMRCHHNLSIIGTTLRYRFGNGELSDSAFIPFDNQDRWEFTSSASYFRYPNAHQRNIIPTTYQVASRCEILVGLRIAQFGSRTGRTEGRIDLLYQLISSTPPGGGPITRFYDQIRHTAETLGGDSGAPVFAMQNGKYVLVATTFASRGSASKITNITCGDVGLDVTIVANFAEPPFITNVLTDGTIEIVGLRNQFERLVIHTAMNVDGTERRVTRIATGAFANQPYLTSIYFTIANNITLAPKAFYGTDAMIRVFGTSIPDYFFYGTYARRVTIPSTVASRVNSIGPNSFDIYTTVYIEEGTNSIAQNLFVGTNVKNIVVPESVVWGSIGTNAFATNDGVNTTIRITGNAIVIVRNRFANTGLKNVIIPGAVQFIDSNAFGNNTNLKTVTIEQETGNPITLTLGAFYNTNIQQIYLPNRDMVNAYRANPAWRNAFTVDGFFRYYVFRVLGELSPHSDLKREIIAINTAISAIAIQEFETTTDRLNALAALRNQIENREFSNTSEDERLSFGPSAIYMWNEATLKALEFEVM
ncbi:MAG: leucine-rich repeat protein [Firmicutes bacterium]|nr:leucine-rich repeat protein [Bacillota bacterium]